MFTMIQPDALYTDYTPRPFYTNCCTNTAYHGNGLKGRNGRNCVVVVSTSLKLGHEDNDASRFSMRMQFLNPKVVKHVKVLIQLMSFICQ